MPTVIDSLVIELGLDPKKFLGGQKQIQQAFKQMLEDARRGGNETEKRGRELGDNIANLKRQALGLVSLFLGGKGVKEFFGYVTNLDAATGRFAKTLDISAQELSAWQAAIKSVGGSAESAGQAIGGLTTDVQRFLLGAGAGGFVQLFNALDISLTKVNGKLKTADELLIEVAGSQKLLAQGSAARQAAFLGLFPGMNQDMINLLLLGPEELQKRLAQGRRTAPTDNDVKVAQEYQKAAADLDRAATNLGRAFTVLVSSPAITAMEAFSNLFHALSGKPAQDEEKFRRRRPDGSLVPRAYEGPKEPAVPVPLNQLPAMPKLSKAPPSAKEQEAYIRQAAIARGIDPDIAVRVARSEGLNNWKSTIPGEESYGPFQLHYGGRGQKGNLAARGLGDDFTKQTGLDAADPANWKQGVDFALDAARRQGWGAWYGWKGAKWQGIPRSGAIGAPAAAVTGSTSTTTNAGNTNTTSVSVGQVTVNTQATDAEGIARDIAPALRRQTLAAPMNHGQE